MAIWGNSCEPAPTSNAFANKSKLLGAPDAMKNVLQKVALIVLVYSVCGIAQSQTPVSRADDEFKQLMPFVAGLSDAYQKDPEAFIRLVSPYAPLDIRVANASAEEEESLRNYYLGTVGAAFGVNAAEIAEQYHCGPECVANRRDVLLSELGNIRDLSKRVADVKNLYLVGVWGVRDSYRVNNCFHLLGQTNESARSPQMGFLPSANWISWNSPNEYFAHAGLDVETVMAILEDLRTLPVVALAVKDNEVVVIASGLSDNQSGLYFGNRALAIGDAGVNGGKYVYVEQINKGEWYFETS